MAKAMPYVVSAGLNQSLIKEHWTRPRSLGALRFSRVTTQNVIQNDSFCQFIKIARSLSQCKIGGFDCRQKKLKSYLNQQFIASQWVGILATSRGRLSTCSSIQGNLRSLASLRR